MTEATGGESRPAGNTPDAAEGGPISAGAMLRAARERQGVHIAMLAAAIKVSPRKLDALEHDRYDELPDATFTRALALTVCRALKIDAQPVLAKLPQGGTAGLEQVNGGLNTPFRERPVRADVGAITPPIPLVWGGVALLIAAAVVWLWPAGGWQWGWGEPQSPASVASAAAGAAAVPASSPVAEPLATSDPSEAAGASAAPAASAPAVETVHAAPPTAVSRSASRGVTVITTDQSWIEIVDASGQALLSRVVQPGETVYVDGEVPMRLKVGNARATQLVFRGQPVELEPYTRDNVARVELK